MRVIYERCCGLDVHKKTVVACAITPGGVELRTFGAMTVDLLQLADWLVAKGVTHVAMESTGVYWKPVYNLLEGLGLTLLVVNAQHIKAVPGRKTDVKDAEWIADLLRHGLVRGSYIPDRPQRELQELVRYRRSLIRQRGQVVQRIQKVLEGANIKLSAVASDVLVQQDSAAFRRWLQHYTQALGVEVLVTDDLATYRPVSHQLGLPQQVCLAHVRKWVANRLRSIHGWEQEQALIRETVRAFKSVVGTLAGVALSQWLYSGATVHDLGELAA